MTNETGDAGASPNGGGNARTWWIVGGVVAAIAIIVAIVAATGGGDEEETTTTVAADTTTTTAAEETTTTAAEETTTTAGEDTTTTTSGEVEVEPIVACQVTDTGGIDDKSFNQTAWKGVQDAIAAGLATEDSIFLESQTEADYTPNINSTIERGCDLTITVGFLLGDATAEAAAANPEQPFTILDFAYDPAIDNVVGAVFDTAPAAFLAGYTAAGMSETGVVATYGGIQIPGAVTAFMDGFVWGVRYYNAQNGTDVQVLGWNPEDQTGTFTGDFENTANGKQVSESFIQEGADVILPVAGPVGEGSAQAAQEATAAGNPVWVIGVDADWFQTLPQYSDVILTSVLKGLDVAVFTEIQEVAEGTFEGGTRVFTLAEDGVGLGAYNDAVSQELRAEVEAVRVGLVDGSIETEQPAG